MKQPWMLKLPINILIATTLIAATPAIAESINHAKSYKAENYKGEALPQCPGLDLLDGLYVGAAAGYDSYRVINRVLADSPFIDPLNVGSFQFAPRLNATGAVGGGLVGFGKYFERFYNTYVAVELFGNGSAANSDYELINNSAVSEVFKTKVSIKSSYGVSLLPGIKLNNTTLSYIRLGCNWSDIEVHQSFISDGTAVQINNKSNSSRGFNYGLGLESAFYNNFSTRAEYTHTDYSSFKTDIDSKITAASNQFMLALIYHFV